MTFTVRPVPPAGDDWKAVNESLQKSSRFVIKNLTTGDHLKIRVVAVNEGGRSPPVTLPEPVLVKEVAGKTTQIKYQQFQTDWLKGTGEMVTGNIVGKKLWVETFFFFIFNPFQHEI